MSDNPASDLAKKRWDKTTPEERSDVARALNEARWGTKKKGAQKKLADPWIENAFAAMRPPKKGAPKKARKKVKR